MAIVFELWAQCEDEANALRLASHFNGLSCSLMSGRTIGCSAGVDRDQPRAVSVGSFDLSRYGVRSLQDALEATEVGLRWYHHLLSAPSFRYARVAWEAWTHPMEELNDWVNTMADGRRYLQIDCVTDDALWEELGRPIEMGQFKAGYRWNAYRGEFYNPLFSADHPELLNLQRELLPTYP